MHRDPTADADSDRSDLGFAAICTMCPYANSTIGAPCRHAKVAKCIDDPAFHSVDEAAYVTSAAGKIEDEIANPLTWAMVRIAPAASRFDHIEAGVQ